MTAANATIDAGVCGFITEARAACEDGQHVRFEVDSPCDNIQGLAARLAEVGDVDAFAEIGDGFDGEVHRAARASLKGCCSGCVVPNGIYKAMQVAAGLALARPASISLEVGETPAQ